MEKRHSFDVSLQPPRPRIYSLMVFPFEKYLTDNLKTDGLIFFIIAYLNIIKTFCLINSKNLTG